MKVSTTFTTASAAIALVGAIGLVYAQSSEESLGASTSEPSPAATIDVAPPPVMDMQQQQPSSTTTPPSDMSAPQTQAGTQDQPQSSGPTSTPAATTAPDSSHDQQPSTMSERSPRADRN